MIKVICRKEYNTETAELIKKFTVGYYGDPSGYEEILYRTREGFYFIYVQGGEDSPYPSEDISRIAKTKVNKWLNTH